MVTIYVQGGGVMLRSRTPGVTIVDGPPTQKIARPAPVIPQKYQQKRGK